MMATGVSYISRNKLVTIKEPTPAKEFLTKNWERISSDLVTEGSISLIGHTRYATSGHKTDQPMADDNFSLALNGVITQADPSKWKELFDVDCDTTNDAEIAFKKIDGIHHPLDLSGGPDDTHCSMALVTLTKEGSIQAFRNGRRPAWSAIWGNNVFIASTKDIIKRATKLADIDSCASLRRCSIYDVNSEDVKMIAKKININLEDWQ